MASAPANSVDFRRLIEASPEVTAVFAADEQLTVLAASDAYLAATLKSREELVGHPIFDVFPERPDTPGATDEAEVRAVIVRAIETKEICVMGPYRYDIERPDSQGGGFAERYWKQRNIPICDDNGDVVCVIHRVEEVTDFIMQERQKNMRSETGRLDNVLEELRRSQDQDIRRQFYDMFKKAPAFICMLEGPQHVFMMANPAYYELIDHREVIGHPVREVFPEREMQDFIAMLDSVYSTGTPQFFDEEEVVLRAAETDQPRRRYATFAYLPTYDMHGNVEGVACFGFEVTELVEARKKVEQQAARAELENRHKDEFLAMLGHELRNPLAPIATAVDILRDPKGEIDREQVEWASELIHRQLNQLVRLVDDLLDVARINRGRIELKEQPCALDEIVWRAVESCRPLIDRKEQRLEVSLPEEALEVEVDVARVVQVIANLLNNASKYTHHGGCIELAVRSDGQTLLIEVSDNGRGIDPEHLSVIFDLFTQTETSLDRSEGGLGLGLTLVRRIVEMHGGEVEAFSEGSGCGSRFRVELPVVIDRGGAEDPGTPDDVASRQTHRVLIVDDNRDAADILAMLLRVEGNDVEIAYDGKTALELARRFEPHLIFLDIGLPEMDGYEVARRLRADPCFERTVIVAVTGYGQSDDRERALEAGFDRHLVKPASHADIRRVLAAV